MTTSSNGVLAGPVGAELRLICPSKRVPLREQGNRLTPLDGSHHEGQSWEKRNGFYDLILGERFEDTTDEACRCYEVESNRYSTENFWVPLFQKLFPDYKTRKYRLLSMGCGIGVEVDILCDAGFACFGIDNGNRAVEWVKRKHPEGLIMANGMALPFEDGTFDAVFCGCVFPHVGVVGDSSQVSENGADQRQRLANEMARVTRKGGYVIACSPNRRFPFDIFHGRKSGSYKPKFNPPWSRFLISTGDFRKMFVKAGCHRVDALPVEGFWGFVTMQKTLKGRMLSWPIRLSFRLASSKAFSFLRSSPFVPWIAVQCQK
jgi:SAM-dependent methyltransferase